MLSGIQSTRHVLVEVGVKHHRRCNEERWLEMFTFCSVKKVTYKYHVQGSVIDRHCQAKVHTYGYKGMWLD